MVGLGNPGPQYVSTRHNIGFRLLDRLGRDLGAGPEEDEGDYRVAWARLGAVRVALLRPMLFMNRSGEALARFPGSEEAGPGLHLVVLDDAWLPFGALRFRRRGGAGGHNGLQSILDSMGTVEVPRLRLGIGGAETEEDLTEYVLATFSKQEEDALPSWLDRACEGVRVFLGEGSDAAMNRFNRLLEK